MYVWYVEGHVSLVGRRACKSGRYMEVGVLGWQLYDGRSFRLASMVMKVGDLG